jgi:hypothetical protein
MAETYHEDLIEHLEVEKRRVTNGVNTVLEIERTGERYQSSELAKLVVLAKAACGHEGCAVAAEYQGNPRPPDPSG